MTQSEELADFAVRASFEELSSPAREALAIRVLDALGCAIGALGSESVRLVRQQVEEFAGTPLCTMIGEGRTAPDRAAFCSGAMVRYLDFNDSYVAKGETCHPSDNVAPVLAAAEYAGRSGREFLTVLAVAYQVNLSLPYLLAVAVLDGQVMPEQYAAERILRSDVQRLLHKVSVRPRGDLSRRFPEEMPAELRILLRGGQVFEAHRSGFEGFLIRPVSWKQAVRKFERLTASHGTASRLSEIAEAVAKLDSIQVSELTRLLEGVTSDERN